MSQQLVRTLVRAMEVQGRFGGGGGTKTKIDKKTRDEIIELLDSAHKKVVLQDKVDVQEATARNGCEELGNYVACDPLVKGECPPEHMFKTGGELANKPYSKFYEVSGDRRRRCIPELLLNTGTMDDEGNAASNDSMDARLFKLWQGIGIIKKSWDESMHFNGTLIPNPMTYTESNEGSAEELPKATECDGGKRSRAACEMLMQPREMGATYGERCEWVSDAEKEKLQKENDDDYRLFQQKQDGFTDQTKSRENFVKYTTSKHGGKLSNCVPSIPGRRQYRPMVQHDVEMSRSRRDKIPEMKYDIDSDEWKPTGGIIDYKSQDEHPLEVVGPFGNRRQVYTGGTYSIMIPIFMAAEKNQKKSDDPTKFKKGMILVKLWNAVTDHNPIGGGSNKKTVFQGSRDHKLSNSKKIIKYLARHYPSHIPDDLGSVRDITDVHASFMEDQAAMLKMDPTMSPQATMKYMLTIMLRHHINQPVPMRHLEYPVVKDIMHSLLSHSSFGGYVVPFLNNSPTGYDTNKYAAFKARLNGEEDGVDAQILAEDDPGLREAYCNKMKLHCLGATSTADYESFVQRLNGFIEDDETVFMIVQRCFSAIDTLYSIINNLTPQ